MLVEIVRADPQNEQAWLWLARAAKSPDEQQKALQRVLAINPGNEMAQRALAERSPQKDIVPDQARITELLGDAVFADDWWQAEALYSEVLELDPAQPEALDAMLKHYVKAKDWRTGLTLLRNARRGHADEEALTRRLVDFVLESGDTDLLRQLDEILLKHPAVTVEQLLKAGEIFASVKQYEIVTYLLERASELEPQNQTVLFGLASAYGASNRHKTSQRNPKTHRGCGSQIHPGPAHDGSPAGSRSLCAALHAREYAGCRARGPSDWRCRLSCWFSLTMD